MAEVSAQSARCNTNQLEDKDKDRDKRRAMHTGGGRDSEAYGFTESYAIHQDTRKVKAMKKRKRGARTAAGQAGPPVSPSYP